MNIERGSLSANIFAILMVMTTSLGVRVNGNSLFFFCSRVYLWCMSLQRLLARADADHVHFALRPVVCVSISFSYPRENGAAALFRASFGQPQAAVRVSRHHPCANNHHVGGHHDHEPDSNPTGSSVAWIGLFAIVVRVVTPCRSVDWSMEARHDGSPSPFRS